MPIVFEEGCDDCDDPCEPHAEGSDEEFGCLKEDNNSGKSFFFQIY